MKIFTDYAWVSILTFLVDIVAFNLFISSGLPLVPSHVFSVLCAVTFSYWALIRRVFRRNFKFGPVVRAGSFLVINAAALATSTLLIWAIQLAVEIDSTVASNILKFSVVGAVAVLKFLGFRFWTFRVGKPT